MRPPKPQSLSRLTSVLALASTTLAVVAAASCASTAGDREFGPAFGAPDGGDGASPTDDASGTSDASGASDASDGASEGGPSCTGTVAILAGGDASLTGVLSVDGAAFAGGAVAGGAAKSRPALVAFGGGFLGVTHGAGDALVSLSAAAGATSFGAPTTIVASGVKDAPALAVVGTSAHVVWVGGDGANRLLSHGVNAGASWDAADDPVGAPQDFSSAAAAIAPQGTSLALSEVGTDEKLYVRTHDAAWSASSPVGGVTNAAEDGVPTVLLALDAGGAFDLVMLYTDDTSVHDVGYVTHASGPGGAWNAAGSIALAETGASMSAAVIAPAKILMAFEGNDGKAYTSIGTIGASDIAWSAPAAIPLVTALDGPPAVAKGVCGADAIVAFSSAGVVSTVRYVAGAFGAPAAVSGASGARLAIATE